MSKETDAGHGAVAGRVERPVRPRCYAENSMLLILDETGFCHAELTAAPRARKSPLYDQAALDAAVASERERCATECRAMAEGLREASPLDGSRAAVAQELERRIRGA